MTIFWHTQFFFFFPSELKKSSSYICTWKLLDTSTKSVLFNRVKWLEFCIFFDYYVHPILRLPLRTQKLLLYVDSKAPWYYEQKVSFPIEWNDLEFATSKMTMYWKWKLQKPRSERYKTQVQKDTFCWRISSSLVCMWQSHFGAYGLTQWWGGGAIQEPNDQSTSLLTVEEDGDFLSTNWWELLLTCCGSCLSRRRSKFFFELAAATGGGGMKPSCRAVDNDAMTTSSSSCCCCCSDSCLKHLWPCCNSKLSNQLPTKKQQQK